MTVNIILPLEPIDKNHYEFLKNRICNYFDDKIIRLFCMSNAIHEHEVDSFVDDFENFIPKESDHICFIHEPNGTNPNGEIKYAPFTLNEKRNQYYIDKMGRIYPYPTDIDILKENYEHIHAHIFNRLSPKGPFGGFYYFPYGYLFRDTSVGKIDSVGFRVPDNLDWLINREKNHKLIVIFGGSAAFSMFSDTKEMFSSVLQKKLNNRFGEEKNEMKFTVLNYGMHGNIILNQITNYILYVAKLKPDLVISHDGWNDMAYGLMSDRHLIQKHNIISQNNLENWAQMLHGSYDQTLTQNVIPFESNNIPFIVLRSYIYRKRQFEEIVNSSGGQFIWGTQPSIFDKEIITETEKKRTDMKQEESLFRVYKDTKLLLQKVQKYLSSNTPKYYVNFCKVFKTAPSDQTHFGDHVHTVPNGDELIAETYCNYIIDQQILNVFDKNG